MGSLEDGSAKRAISESMVEELRSQLDASKLLTPKSEGYGESLKRWSEAAERKAGLVLLATSGSDISKAVVFAKKYKVGLAVRGGGHSTSGASSSTGGLVVDLSQMRAVTVDPENRTITAQGGALWSDVNITAGDYGLSTPGGTVENTGVGGLTLGGGYGFLSSKYGLVIDNLISVRMVLADGRIVTASQQENADLFWAVRGAGHNFGVCIEFVYRAYEQSDVWSGILLFTMDKLEAIINFLNDLAETKDPASPAFLGFGCLPPAHKPMCFVSVFHDGPEAAAKKSFQPLLDIGPVYNGAGVRPYKDAQAVSEESLPGGRRRIKGGAFTAPLDVAFAKHCLERFTEFIAEVPDAGGSITAFEFFDSSKIAQVPYGATAFCNRGSHHNSAVGLKWTDPKFDDACRDFAHQMKDMFDREMRKSSEGGLVSTQGSKVYINNVELAIYGLAGEMKVQDVFGPNYERLQKVKGKYDPDNLFDRMHPIQPVIDSSA